MGFDEAKVRLLIRDQKVLKETKKNNNRGAKRTCEKGNMGWLLSSFPPATKSIYYVKPPMVNGAGIMNFAAFLVG